MMVVRFHAMAWCFRLAQHLVLAGILARQEDELRQAYAPWCVLEVSDQEDGWILMTARF